MSILNKYNYAKSVCLICTIVLSASVALAQTQPAAQAPATAKKAAKKNADKKNKYDGMSLIPAGTFWMGAPDTDSRSRDDERPRHKVYLDAFYIDKYDVTVRDYAVCVRAGKCTPPITDAELEKKNTDDYNTAVGNKSDKKISSLYSDADPYNLKPDCSWGKVDRDNYPVDCVTWDQAKAYCEWENKRLPTEAEWEKAARGGTDTRWSFGNDPSVADQYEWCLEDADEYKKAHTHPVGQKKPNQYDLYDMYGNMDQWVSDLYAPDYYSKSPLKNPKGAKHGDNQWGDSRVARGSNAKTQCVETRAAMREQADAASAGGSFRCAVN
jgi:formylglycine-generating enzyme required for sulfatase activity